MLYTYGIRVPYLTYLTTMVYTRIQSGKSRQLAMFASLLIFRTSSFFLVMIDKFVLILHLDMFRLTMIDNVVYEVYCALRVTIDAWHWSVGSTRNQKVGNQSV